MNVPLAKPYIDDDEINAAAAVLRSGWLVQGPRVAEFEENFTRYTGAKFAKATTSCTTALHLALLSSGVQPGEKVLVSSYTYIASANAIEYVGAEPVFIDIDDSFNIDPQKVIEYIEQHKDSNVRGIMPIHLFGLSADMDPIMEVADAYDLHVIEDAACALGTLYHGKHVGTIGDAGCFSFHPRKSITTGEGGMITTNNPEIDTAVKSLRDHGASVSDRDRHENQGFLLPDFNILGYNFRMTDIQGAIGIEQMKKISRILEERLKRVNIYHEQLKDVAWFRLPLEPEGYKHTYQSYVIHLVNPGSSEIPLDDFTQIRNRIMNEMDSRGIATRQGTSAVHTLGYYKQKYGLKENDYPVALAAERLSIAIPLFIQMTDQEQEYVIENLLEVTKQVLG